MPAVVRDGNTRKALAAIRCGNKGNFRGGISDIQHEKGGACGVIANNRILAIWEKSGSRRVIQRNARWAVWRAQAPQVSMTVAAGFQERDFSVIADRQTDQAARKC